MAVFVFLRDLIDFSVEMQDWFLILLWFIFPYFSLLVFGILRLEHLVLQNVNKDYIKFLYFRNFATKSDQKPKNGMNKVKKYKLCSKLIVACKIVRAYTDEKIGSKISYKIINQPQQQQKKFWFMSCSSHIFVFRFLVLW